MKQVCVYTKGDQLVAIVPICEEPNVGEFNTYYVGSGETLAEAVGNAIMEWFGFSAVD